MRISISLFITILSTIITIYGPCGAGPAKTPVNPAAGRWRALHLINYRSDKDLEDLENDIPKLAGMGINVLILEVNYGFEYKSHPELRMGRTPVTYDGARRMVKTCREHGIRLIPQFNCLGHQSWKKQTFPLLAKYPELDLTPGAFPDNEGIYCREWDPLNPKVYEIVLPMIDELIDAFDADAMHVGMDEVFLINSKYSPSTRGKNPAQVFAKAVSILHKHLVKRRGVEMLMWGDRFIDAEVYKYGKWEASANGTAPAVDMVPKDIIICDWHYEMRESYPSVPMFLEKGFRVLPAGWKNVDATKALIRYSRDQKSPNMLGHLFTTWSGRKKWREFPPLVEGLKLLKQPTKQTGKD